MKILIATQNPGKIREFKALLPDFDVLSLADIHGIDDIIEDGVTFADNAIKKAVTLAAHTGCWTIADDSGLEVDALDGAPGVYSARYAGEDCDPDDNIIKLLAALKDVPQDGRTARFRCTIALAKTPEDVMTVDGTCDGKILFERRGQHGFGYDPVFFSPELGKTFAQASPAEKHDVSHRGRAIQKILPFVKSMIDG